MSTSINIVELIEKNPITRLSGTYNNKLLSRIKDNFTETQQSIFVTSFYCFLNYNQKSDFVIDLDNIWKWLGFSQKCAAKRMLEKNFILDEDYKTILPDVQDRGHGGNNRETMMLNVQTFKLLCVKSDTKKADEIHKYFVKLELLLQEVIHEESNELKKQLEQRGNEILDIENKNKSEYTKLLKEKEIEKQNILLTEYNKNVSLIYIAKIKSYDNGEYVIKIGESRRGVVERFNEHKSSYDEILLLDCFAVNRSKDFESFLHSHDSIKINKVSDLAGHLSEKELFLIGKNLTYSTLIQIIKNNVKYFNEYNDREIEKTRMEYESLKLITEMNGTDIMEFIKKFINYDRDILEKIDKSNRETAERIEKSNRELIEKVSKNENVPKTTTGFNTPLVTLGPRLQKINPETLQLIRVYETVSECMNEDNKIKRPSLNKAVIENTIYNGFRWLLVDREKNADTITSIEKTKETRAQNLGYIAKMNKEKTEILNVYLDRKNASSCNGYQSLSGLDTCVKKFTLSNGHYYLLYESCADELKEKFVEKYGEPLLYKDGVGQFDHNNVLTREFMCKYDCIKSLKISDKTLEKLLNKDQTYHDYSYKNIGSKLRANLL